MYRGIILDCDGVLFDSLQANIAFYNHLLASFSKPPMRDKQIEFVHAATAEESVTYLFKGDTALEEARNLQRRTDYNRFIPYMKLAPHALESLKILKAEGKMLAICTNRSTSMPAILKHFGIADLFECVITSLDVTRPKPDPEGLLAVLRAFGLDSPEAVYVGDSIIDQVASRLAGIPFAAYGNPGLDADYHLRDFSQLVTIQPLSGGKQYASR
jgi:HAD superfamily hydrolase (TIGR01509 family)